MIDFLSPVQLGEFQLKNRLVMAPLTRCRSSEGRLSNALMVEYYRQRASAGLILSEATVVSPMGVGYPNTPGIYNEAQARAWQPVTEAVHQKEGLILCQLWHVGRVSHESYLGGQAPLAPSAIAPDGHVSLLRPKVPFSKPRALEISEIQQIIQEFKRGAELAKLAGFDGIELHAANGYLIDQFLQDKTNQRNDAYGGSIENRSRFLLEILDACAQVWPAGRIAVHLAPRGDAHDMGDSYPKALFRYVASELGKRKVAFIFTREYQGEDSISQEIKAAFGGPLIANEGLDRESALALLQEGKAEAVAFGKLFIANPDLPQRLASASALNPWDESSFHGGTEKGYTDYPYLPA